jgi:hypothetical protein
LEVLAPAAEKITQWVLMQAQIARSDNVLPFPAIAKGG